LFLFDLLPPSYFLSPFRLIWAGGYEVPATNQGKKGKYSKHKRRHGLTLGMAQAADLIKEDYRRTTPADVPDPSKTNNTFVMGIHRARPHVSHEEV
jgi:hypothetical protein